MRNLPVVLAVTIVAQSLGAQKYIRFNQVGYLPDALKVAVVCARASVPVSAFIVRDSRSTASPQRARRTQRTAHRSGPFGPCVETYRLDFSYVRAAGTYVIEVEGAESVKVRV